MTRAAEAPGFADEEVLAVSDLSLNLADKLDLVSPVMGQAGATSYHVLLLWGHLPKAHDQEDADVQPSPIEWSGSVSVDQGAIGLKRTLAFDEHDSMAPRDAPNSLSFISHTLPAVDGVLLHVAIPSGGAKLLHFGTAALTTDIDLSDLHGGAVPLGDGRNGLAFIGYEDSPGVARGFVLGRWVKLQASLCKLRGRVVSGDGDVLGHMKGIWGHAPRRNADVFFGKYINTDGEFHGLFGGKYGDGSFQGIWGTADPQNAGVLEGRYVDGFDEADGRGAFLGRWSETIAN
jgi:hypothetical protein